MNDFFQPISAWELSILRDVVLNYPKKSLVGFAAIFFTDFQKAMHDLRITFLYTDNYLQGTLLSALLTVGEQKNPNIKKDLCKYTLETIHKKSNETKDFLTTYFINLFNYVKSN